MQILIFPLISKLWMMMAINGDHTIVQECGDKYPWLHLSILGAITVQHHII